MTGTPLILYVWIHIFAHSRDRYDSTRPWENLINKMRLPPPFADSNLYLPDLGLDNPLDWFEFVWNRLAQRLLSQAVGEPYQQDAAATAVCR